MGKNATRNWRGNSNVSQWMQWPKQTAVADMLRKATRHAIGVKSNGIISDAKSTDVTRRRSSLQTNIPHYW